MSTPLNHLSWLMWSRSFNSQLSQSCLMARNACVCPRQMDFDFCKPWKVGQVGLQACLQIQETMPQPAKEHSPTRARLNVTQYFLTSPRFRPRLPFERTENPAWHLTFGSDSDPQISAEAALWMCLAPLVPISCSLSSWEMQWSTSGGHTAAAESCREELAKILIAHLQFPEIDWKRRKHEKLCRETRTA